MSDAWTKRTLRKFLLRDAEALARRLSDEDRRRLRDQIARARQKVESAKVLWSSEQYVEGLRLCEEGLSESLGAVELAGPAFAEEASSDDGVWERVLTQLGASPEELAQARAALTGPGPSRPSLNGEVTPQHRRYTRTAVWVSESALSRVGRLATGPARIVASRFLRLASVAAVFIAVVAGVVTLGTKTWVKASGEYPDARFVAKHAIDGNPRTEWLLPNRVAGSIEVSFSKRDLSAVKLLNCSNPPPNDRASRDVRVECLRDDKPLGTAKHTFPTLSPNPTWVRIPLACKGADGVRIWIDTWHNWGGGLAELAWE